MKNITITLLAILSFLTISCNNDKNDDIIIGKWEDNIKLSQKTATVTSESNSITITTQGESWWLNGIALNKVMIDLGKVDTFAKNFVVTNSEFQLERKNGKTIIITMNKNTTNAERVLSIALEDGDYFDNINITQSK
ncbi:hypothetical protein [Flavobacterium sp. LC2016-01]|uniref:hypothetical protein n=1 Tax=Flavobacterium sp. LC2016-01 TaxID=2675876 RepID=UPI0012BA8525|nr:hypothetical protein [Flavobacterium sp. LC2016-01]MTH16926.1 hypothetical protein [Flavobacterium sp. LC2016-01]